MTLCRMCKTAVTELVSRYTGQLCPDCLLRLFVEERREPDSANSD